ncbi:MerR family transcriptional regulator [Pelagibacteraceae bacterium]|jgi:DNA-binding transcriptional MerR regulator|nr:MerR family transcriptional regulator [Pelagibacteraceae bacterium]|tara:strand:- start:2560 stop:2919 length:360 start_codon:yes stop_codon:yes gene_type:complete
MQKLVSISELAKNIGLVDKKGKPLNHTLRYWEKCFRQIKPTLMPGNRRYYTKNNVDLIKLIKFLLKEQSFTILGVKKLLSKNINNLDQYKSSSIKAEYYKKILSTKTKNLLLKIKKLKN